MLPVAAVSCCLLLRFTFLRFFGFGFGFGFGKFCLWFWFWFWITREIRQANKRPLCWFLVLGSGGRAKTFPRDGHGPHIAARDTLVPYCYVQHSFLCFYGTSPQVFFTTQASHQTRLKEPVFIPVEFEDTSTPHCPFRIETFM